MNFFRSIRKGSDVKECPRYLLDALKSNGVTGVSDSSICRVLPTLSEVDRIAWRTEIHILDLDARRRKEIERDLSLKKEGPLSSHLLEGHDGP